MHANAGNLETFVINLEHNFTIIVALEAWKPKGKTSNPYPELSNCKPFYGTCGTTTKSCGGFYIKSE